MQERNKAIFLNLLLLSNIKADIPSIKFKGIPKSIVNTHGIAYGSPQPTDMNRK